MEIQDIEASILESRAFMNDSEAQAELKRRDMASFINEQTLPEIDFESVQ